MSPEVAGPVPAVVEGGGSGLRRLPVALGHVGAAHQQLAVFGEAHLHSGHGRPRRSEVGALHGVAADDGAGLGGAVALDDPDPQPLPLGAQLRVQGRAAAEDELEGPAQPLQHAPEDDAAGPVRQPSGDGVRPLPELLLALSRNLPLYRLHQQIEGLGHQQHERRAALRGRRYQHGRLEAGEIGDVGSGLERDEQAAHLLEHVAQREYRQQPVGRLAGDVPGDSHHVGQEVAVRQHHALRVACRSRREHHLDEIVPAEIDRAGLRHGARLLLDPVEQQLRHVEALRAPWASRWRRRPAWAVSSKTPLRRTPGCSSGRAGPAPRPPARIRSRRAPTADSWAPQSRTRSPFPIPLDWRRLATRPAPSQRSR